MATVQSTSASQPDTPAPTFSYAQAARGRSPQAEDGSSSKQALEFSQSPDRSSSQQMPKSEAPIEVGKTQETATETKVELQSSIEGETGKSVVDAESLSKSQSQTRTISTPVQPLKDEPVSPSQPVPSAASAPSKEDDVFAVPSDLGESTWDRVSQGSHSEDKQINRVEGDGDDTNITSWEHVSAPSQFKDAPPPSFNVWEKRALDAKSKVKDVKQSLPSLGSNQKHDVISAPTRKGSEGGQDLSRLENRKKKPSTQQVDEKGGPGPKDSSKSTDNKLRNGEEGEPQPASPWLIVTPTDHRYRQGSPTRITKSRHQQGGDEHGPSATTGRRDVVANSRPF